MRRSRSQYLDEKRAFMCPYNGYTSRDARLIAYSAYVRQSYIADFAHGAQPTACTY